MNQPDRLKVGFMSGPIACDAFEIKNDGRIDQNRFPWASHAGVMISSVAACLFVVALIFLFPACFDASTTITIDGYSQPRPHRVFEDRNVMVKTRGRMML